MVGTPRPAHGARAGAAKAGRGNEPIAPAGIVGRDDARCVAVRAVDVQLRAVPTDVAYGLEWKPSEHGANRNAAGCPDPYVSSDSTMRTMRHAGAQQCMRALLAKRRAPNWAEATAC